MMNIFYETGNAKNSDFDPFVIRKMNPNSAWANHSYNHFVLCHISVIPLTLAKKFKPARKLKSLNGK